MVTKGKKLKIGIVCYPSVGGSGIVATGLGQALAKLGHQVHFISYESPFALCIKHKNIYFHKVTFSGYELFKYPDYTLPLAVKMVEVSKKYKLDVLHVHYAVPHATAALLAKDIANKQKIKFPNVVTTLHGTDITLLARDKTVMPVIKYSIESSCGVTAVSNSLKKDTKKALKTSKHIEVIYNFYNPKEITESRFAIRKKLGVKESDFFVIHLSNLRAVKLIPDLLKIISKVKKNKNIKLLILAGADFAPYQNLVKKLGITGRVIIKNNVKDIQNYINASDIGLYTSGEESFGMGILETMSYGKPVLTTNVGGIKESMINGKTGFMFGIGKVNDFSKKLLELSYNSELVEKLGENASIRASRARWELFDASSAPHVAERLELEGDLWRALDQQELVVHYQPEFDLRTGYIVGAEALVRWEHPRRGLLQPGAFVPFAEESSLILSIDRYVMRAAFHQARRWADQQVPEHNGGETVIVSVNLSPRFVRQPDLLEEINDAIAESGVDPRWVRFEITERTALTDLERTVETLEGLRRLGIRVAIDDFGTGYSSLGYLKRLPVDVVKLDRTFVESMDTSDTDLAIVQAVITMGHALGMEVTAEGVERTEQAERLAALRCDTAMGWLWSPAVAADDLADLLRTGVVPAGV